ncbi:MAG: hypothetical protein NCW75_05700 [Phycisphaera sp.]|nr:MAG: hypothetical protein NCW75_05700 [Phycisphaera sp.]
MKTQIIIERMEAQAAERRHDQLCRAAAEAAGWGGVTKQRLCGLLACGMVEAGKILDELIRLDICDVRFDAEDRSRVDWYPVNNEFLEMCRERAHPGPFGGDHLIEVIKRVLSTQE